MTIAGTEAERATIESWLRQICLGVAVDRKTGAVSVDQSASGPGYRSGCGCLATLVDGTRKVTVNPLHNPSDPIPGTGRPPNPAKGDPGEPPETIGGMGGGCTGTTATGGVEDKGKPGVGPDGKPGSDVQVYVDMSDNANKGYDLKKNGGGTIPNPLWLILSHELTSGHASHYTQGTSLPSDRGRENQARLSENRHRKEHKLADRPLKD